MSISTMRDFIYCYFRRRVYLIDVIEVYLLNRSIFRLWPSYCFYLFAWPELLLNGTSILLLVDRPWRRRRRVRITSLIWLGRTNLFLLFMEVSQLMNLSMIRRMFNPLIVSHSNVDLSLIFDFKTISLFVTSLSLILDLWIFLHVGGHSFSSYGKCSPSNILYSRFFEDRKSIDYAFFHPALSFSSFFLIATQNRVHLLYLI